MAHRCTLGHYSAAKKNEITPSAAAWTQPKVTIPSEICQKEKGTHHTMLYVESTYGRIEPTYKTETDSQTHRTDLWLLRGRGEGEEKTGSLGLADANC